MLIPAPEVREQSSMLSYVCSVRSMRDQLLSADHGIRIDAGATRSRGITVSKEFRRRCEITNHVADGVPRYPDRNRLLDGSQF